MHPNEERPPQEYWEVDAPPDPTVAQTNGEFLAELEMLLRWSRLSFGEIEQRIRAYDFIAEGAVSEALRDSTLPSEVLLEQMLWAVGCDDEAIDLWLWARERLVAAQEHFDATDVLWVPEDATGYSDSALAQAVQERHGQNGWHGLHRRGLADDATARHTTKRLRPSTSQHAVEKRADWSSRAMVGLVSIGVLALAAGVAAALTSGGETAAPPSGNRPQACCLSSITPEAETPSPLESILPTAATPGVSTKPTVSNTPRPTATTQGPQNTTPPPPAPVLTASASTSCAPQDGKWIVTVNISASLANAQSGTSPQANVGQGVFSLDGSGSTSFSGQTTIDVGPAPAPAAGEVTWTVTVTVAGAGALEKGGTKSYSCAV